MNKSIFVLIFLMAGALACVDNDLWAYNLTCASNCSNASAAYVCFNLTDEITDGVITSAWPTSAIGEILNMTENVTSYCYNNIIDPGIPKHICTTNTTYNGTWLFYARREGIGPTYASCGMTPATASQNIYVYGSTGLLQNFTVLLNITKQTGMNNDFSNIYFRNVTTGGNLTFEFDTINSGVNALVWVRTDYLNSVNNTIKMYWDGYTTWANKTQQAWDDNYVNVLHFSEGSGVLAYDSTYRNHTFTGYNSPHWGTGIVGGAIDLEASESEYLQVPNHNDYDMGATGWTIENFVNWETKPADACVNCQIGIVSRTKYSVQVDWMQNTYQNNPILLSMFYDTLGGYDADSSLGKHSLASQWYANLGQFEPSATNLVNSTINVTVETGTTFAGKIPWDSNNPVTIGHQDPSSEPHATLEFVDGRIDEVRISNLKRDYNWVNYTYYNIVYNSLTTNFETASVPTTFTNYTVFDLNRTQSYGVYTANLKDEADNTIWDMGETKNETITFTCESSQSIKDLTAATQSFILTDTPSVVKVDANFTTTGDHEYRKQVPTCSWPCTEDVDFFLNDLNDTTLVEIEFTLQDWTGLFGEAELRFIRPILSSGNVQITSDYFDASKVALVQLVKDMEYTIQVYKNGVLKSIGKIVVTSDTSKTITIADIAFNPDTVKQFEDILMSAWMDTNYVQGGYNDTSGSTSSVTFTVKNHTTGATVYTTTSGCSECSFAWNHSGNYSTPFDVEIVADVVGIGRLNNTWPVNYFNQTSFVGEGTLKQVTFNWIGTITLIGASLAVGAYSLAGGAILFLILSTILWWMGWLMIPYPVLLASGLFLVGIAISSKKVNT